MVKRKRTPLELEVDRELIEKGEEALKDFDASQEIYVPARRGDAKLISIRLPQEMIRHLREIALQKGDIGYQQMIKLYVSQGLFREQHRISSDAPTVWSTTYSFQGEEPQDVEGSFITESRSFQIQGEE